MREDTESLLEKPPPNINRWNKYVNNFIIFFTWLYNGHSSNASLSLNYFKSTPIRFFFI
jgi:hypothetical protein